MKVLCWLSPDALRPRSLIEILCHTATLVRPNHDLKYLESVVLSTSLIMLPDTDSKP